MADLMRLGANIRGLRTAFGESQEELGAAIFVEKNTVSYYESGKRAPSKETLSAIAKHFAISVDDLLFGDYGFTEKLRFELNYFWRNIRIFLPIISSDAALSNQFFRKTIESHSAMYDKLEKPHEDAFGDILEPLFGCLDNYLAITDENCTVEAAANYPLFLLLFPSLGGCIKHKRHLPSGADAPLLRHPAAASSPRTERTPCRAHHADNKMPA